MKRSKHNLSHSRLASFDMGQLVPVGVVEVLPGDTFRHRSSVLLRVGTLVNPLMHSVTVRLHHWFCSSRMLYDAHWFGQSGAWENFMNGTEDVSENEWLKTMGVDNPTAGSLANHLGIPAGTHAMNVNALPFAAYQIIWDRFYRDQDLDPHVTYEDDTTEYTTLRRICWEKDYFTTARTYPQFGEDTISIPFQSGLQAPIKGIGLIGTPMSDIGQSVTLRETAGNRVAAHAFTGTSGEIGIEANEDSDTARAKIYADLSAAEGGGIDVNEFRRAIALQRFLEARSRYGSRYRDYLRYLGIRPSDGRLEEPEYLGGGKQQIAFSEVLATAEGTSTEVGDMAGHGIAALRTRPYTKFFEEHGFVISLISVRPKAMYMDALNRHWLRGSKDDFWQKEYEAFGPQAVAKKEVYSKHTNESDVFGYQDRFREYREHPSYVSGLFNTTYKDWHMAREFSSVPSLNASFVNCTPTDRVYADAAAPELLCQVQHSLMARRLVGKVSR